MALIALSYVPLAIHELQSGFAETRAFTEFLLGGGAGAGTPLAARLVIVPLRVMSWPLAGLITDRPIVAALVALAVVAALAWRGMAGAGKERTAARWLAATLAWSSLALAVAASSLATVVPGLPNDHYHAFLDPVVFVAVGLAAGALWKLRRPVGPAIAAIAVAALVALNVSIWPPRVAPDGGYPAAEAAARRILAAVPDGRYRLDGLPTLKNPNAYAFPLIRLGGRPDAADPPDDPADVGLVIACDRLLEPIIGTACGGAAEAARLEVLAEDVNLVDRFDASARTVISIYR